MAAAYDPEARILQIEWRSGHVYDYAEVPERVYRALKASRSAGHYFNKQIRDRFTYQRILPISEHTS
jgi:lysyl-tRNA synthetase, class II